MIPRQKKIVVWVLLFATLDNVAVSVRFNGSVGDSSVAHLCRGGEEQSQPSAITLKAEEEQEVTLVENVTETEEDSSSLGPEDVPIPAAPTVQTKRKPKRNERRRHFFDRIAAASSSLLNREEEAKLDDEPNITDPWTDPTSITPQSDLRRPGRYIHIVTTAALPWMTGTAVNPLLRAAYMHEELEGINHDITKKSGKSSWVTLVIPWLELPEDQQKVYNEVFNSTKEQEAYVRTWLRNQANMPEAADNLHIVFYNARYHAGLGSVFAMGDIIEQLPSDELDVCILEEPEHMNWYRAPGKGWTKRYNYVLGIIHTNYDQYATQHYSGLWTAPAIRLMSSAMVRAYCHKVIKLSDVLQPFAPEREITRNVHGVRKEFIQQGRVQWENETYLGEDAQQEGQIYFIGKLLWAKGLNLILEYEDYYRQMTGKYFPVHIYGSGPDQEEIMRAYFGRWRKEENDTDPVASTRKNILVRFFTWINRRPKRSKVSIDDIYKDLLEVFETLPTKAKASVSKVKDIYDETTISRDSVERVSKRFGRAARKLAKDVSKVGFKIDTSSVPMSFYELRRNPVPARFCGRIDHASLKGKHKIFVNPSLSEVLATTTYEALAMGKFAIIPVHPSNTFFQRFPNALMYNSPFEFLANLQWALTHDPVPLTEEMAREFTWEAATDRLIEAAAITHAEARGRENLGRSRMDERIEWFHNQLGRGAKGDVIRKVLGAGPVSEQFKYTQRQLEKEVEDRSESEDEGNESEDQDDEDEEDEEEEGLSRKFENSEIVKAIRQATSITMPAR